MDCREGEEHVDGRDGHRGHEACYARVAEDRRRVVNHHVDADELLEHLQQHPDHENLKEVTAPDNADTGALRPMQRLLHVCYLSVDLLLSVMRPLQHRNRLLFPSLEHQPAWALGEYEAP